MVLGLMRLKTEAGEELGLWKKRDSSWSVKLIGGNFENVVIRDIQRVRNLFLPLIQSLLPSPLNLMQVLIFFCRIEIEELILVLDDHFWMKMIDLRIMIPHPTIQKNPGMPFTFSIKNITGFNVVVNCSSSLKIRRLQHEPCCWLRKLRRGASQSAALTNLEGIA